MGHCIYYRNSGCTNKYKCTWQNDNPNGGRDCRKGGFLEADKLTSKEPVLEQLGIHRVGNRWTLGDHLC